MTVAELIAELQRFDPHLDVVYKCCSDYARLEPGEITVERLIDHGSGSYVETAGGGQSMSPYDKNYNPIPDDKRKSFLVFPGN